MAAVSFVIPFKDKAMVVIVDFSFFTVNDGCTSKSLVSRDLVLLILIAET